MSDLAFNHLQQADPHLWRIWQQVQTIDPRPLVVEPATSGDHFSHLVEAIVGQQLSDKAASTIWERVKATLPDRAVNPQTILAAETASLRQAGLSGAKASYVKNIATAVHDKTLVLADLATLPEDQAIAQLVQVKGIGQWTAEMFLMFALGRQDVFSVGDLGLRRAIERWYRVPADGKDRTVYLHISRVWQPFRTYAAKILWRSLTLPTEITVEMV